MQQGYTHGQWFQCAQMMAGIHKRQHTVQEQGAQDDMHSVTRGKKTPKPNKVKTEDSLERTLNTNWHASPTNMACYDFFNIELHCFSLFSLLRTQENVSSKHIWSSHHGNYCAYRHRGYKKKKKKPFCLWVNICKVSFAPWRVKKRGFKTWRGR